MYKRVRKSLSSVVLEVGLLVDILEGNLIAFWRFEWRSIWKKKVSMQRTTNRSECQSIISGIVFTPINRNNHHFMRKCVAISFYVDIKSYTGNLSFGKHNCTVYKEIQVVKFLLGFFVNVANNGKKSIWYFGNRHLIWIRRKHVC